jgi:hypothetical protein
MRKSFPLSPVLRGEGGVRGAFFENLGFEISDFRLQRKSPSP